MLSVAELDRFLGECFFNRGGIENQRNPFPVAFVRVVPVIEVVPETVGDDEFIVFGVGEDPGVGGGHEALIVHDSGGNPDHRRSRVGEGCQRKSR